ncbi:MAG: peptidase M14 [Sphingobacteriaceae bacterium]|nr:peptidase M14 [Cytophagaceae bacterium]
MKLRFSVAKHLSCLALLGLLTLSPLLAQIPKPADVLGFEPGADYKLADSGTLLDYFQRLDKASERVKLVEIGKSVLGRPLVMLLISSEKNLKQTERFRSINEQLSRARIDEAQARKLATEGRAVVWVDAGMHSSEAASAQMMPELAYRMATEESSEMRKIREEVVTLLMVNLNPDGLDIIADWYKKNLGTAFETSQPPWLYHHYIGHDNNRDWFMNTMPETKAVSKVLYSQWYPQIVYNHHQTSPSWTRIFIPPFADPVNPNIHPGVTTGVNLVGSAMANRFAMRNMPGVVSRLTFSMWWNGGMRTVPYFHNQIGILTETGHATPTPRFYPPDSLPKTIGRGVTASTAATEVFYPNPWRGGESHFRDAVNYMLEASLATLDLAADKREEFLFNIYQMGRDAIAAAGTKTAFAYVIPPAQWDRGEALNLVKLLRESGVEIQRATAAFEAGGTSYSAGSFVVYGGQAFGPYVTDLMEKQVHPNQRLYPGGPPLPPYDLAGWTLPMQMGVKVDRVKTAFTAPTVAVTTTIAEPGQLSGSAGYGYTLPRNENVAVKAVNRLLKAGEKVSLTDAGSFLIEKGSGTEARVQTLATELGLSFTGVATKPGGSLRALKQPRIGLYKSWVANMDEGWTRWLLKEYEFSVDSLHDADILSKDLSQYHAIILPDQSPKGMLHGHTPNTMPAAYVGGLGLAGTAALDRYARQSGTLLAFDEASDFLIDQLGLPLRDVTEGLSTQQFYVPGSLIRTVVDTKHPLAAGMQSEVAASFQNSRAFEVNKQVREGEGGQEKLPMLPAPPVEIVARYAPSGLLMSGWALNEARLANKAAVVRLPHEKGSLVLFGFRPQFRAQPRATYKLVFNALLEGAAEKTIAPAVGGKTE